MEATHLGDLIEELFRTAHDSGSGRGARTIHGGREHSLRQTVIALLADRTLDEHESPGEATLQVLSGRVRLVAGDDARELGAGDFAVIPPRRHHVDALGDAALLLTVAVG